MLKTKHTAPKHLYFVPETPHRLVSCKSHVPSNLKYQESAYPTSLFDCSALTNAHLHSPREVLAFTFALVNLRVTGVYHRRSTFYGIYYQRCDSSSTAAVHTISGWAVPYFAVFMHPAAAVVCSNSNVQCCCAHYQTCLSMLTFILLTHSSAYFH